MERSEFGGVFLLLLLLLRVILADHPFCLYNLLVVPPAVGYVPRTQKLWFLHPPIVDGSPGLLKVPSFCKLISLEKVIRI